MSNRNTEAFQAVANFFRDLLFKSEFGSPGRAFLLSKGVHSPEANDMGVGFAPSKIGRDSQLLHLQSVTGLGVDELIEMRLIRRVDENRLYHFFRDCITRPVRLDGEVIGLVGFRIGVIAPKQMILFTGFGEEERERSDFEEVCDWFFDNLFDESDFPYGSILSGFKFDEFSDMEENLKQKIVVIMARLAEKSYRRGVQQAHACVQAGILDGGSLSGWRYSSLETSPGISGSPNISSLDRLQEQNGDLRQVGLL